MSYSVFNRESGADASGRTMFLGDSVSIARYDKQRYPQIDKLTEKQIGFFWGPEEVDVTRDSKDFRDLTANEQHIFTSNLKRQILLDSVQGRSPSVALMPLVSLPELETWLQTWAFFETIHSRSYTHLIQNVYSDPSVVFDGMLEIEEIVDCAKDISHHYDELIRYTQLYQLFGEGKLEAIHYEGGNSPRRFEEEINLYELKKRLWMCLMSVNILEGIRFYVSFACSWAFAEQKKAMEGNAKIIKFICRDENLHLASTQHILKKLPKEDPDFEKIADETEDECVALFESAVEQEKAWARYLFKDGSMVGLNEEMLGAYVEWIANRRMSSIGLPTKYKGGSNPLPWTQKWISGSEVQVAPQETEITSYIVGGVKKDVSVDSFKGMAL